MITDRYFGGIIDEVALWNRALSQQEVQVLYNGGSGNRVVSNVYTISYSSPSE